jgi:hypothetical protein
MEQVTPASNPTFHNQVIMIAKPKSVGVAFLLSFLFGPLGLLYASVAGGLIMFFAAIIMFFVVPVIGPLLVWVGCIIWAVVAANNANQKAIQQINLNK